MTTIHVGGCSRKSITSRSSQRCQQDCYFREILLGPGVVCINRILTVPAVMSHRAALPRPLRRRLQHRLPLHPIEQIRVPPEALLEPPVVELRQRDRAVVVERAESAVCFEHPQYKSHLTKLSSVRESLRQMRQANADRVRGTDAAEQGPPARRGAVDAEEETVVSW